ncbi:hypothetical protein GOP47_0029238 [Adiantum capillus-veneris]|nr:hypothetical protein GOP47_0029238 [Adiantum capillus-veneris]
MKKDVACVLAERPFGPHRGARWLMLQIHSHEKGTSMETRVHRCGAGWRPFSQKRLRHGYCSRRSK